MRCAGRWLAVGIGLYLLSSCAVRGYELGWRSDNRIAALLGNPLDDLSGCAVSAQTESSSSAACAALATDVDAILVGKTRPPRPASGFKCRGDVCLYQNVFERRDIGLASIVPINRKIVLREVHIKAERDGAGLWRLASLRIRDTAPPGYGPVRIGG